MSIMVTRSSMPSLEEYIEEIKPIFESHFLTNMGPVYKKLQCQLRDFLDVPELSMFVNGHMALEMIIQAMGLDQTGGEIITTPFSFVSTVHAIVRNGLKPVFCDIKIDDYTIDPARIEAHITDKTVAILPVHVYGNVCDVEAIDNLAEKHGIKVIYDAAHAFGVKYKGVGVGNYGDAAMFSFHATKVFHTIEGGAVAFHDPTLSSPLHELKNFGIHGPDDVMAVGANAKMDEFRAAMGICNLRHIDESIANRRAATMRYRENLEHVEGLKLCIPSQEVDSNYAYFPVYFDDKLFGSTRDEVMERLAHHDIFARKYFYPAINELTCYKDSFPQNTPIAHDAAEHILTLPLYDGLSMEDIDHICEIVCG